ncbi:hypothetical protein VTN77DRAFT_7 [Rasamsonia byssochlamydoides]|uniref:uncharacterized protein n=1 Tax=Rasamsonia byssochlamydoides TaxID=89139 RepID=UPI0037449A28
MKILSYAPRASTAVFLPTEIVIQIVSAVAEDDDLDGRQETLYSCCLVSRQWYSAAVPFLYERPRLDKGRSFEKFTRVICPPVGAPKSKANLGSFVRRLNMSGLVHHSSNSLTARLLGRVKENLEVFIAPAASFSINCLASLSKCGNLRYLDLSLVNESIPFTSLKKAISHLQKLVTLRLPRSTILTDPERLQWPPKLQRLQVGGTFKDNMHSFLWPEQITRMSLKNCTDLSVGAMRALVTNPHLGRNLRRLTVSTFNRGLQMESISIIPTYLTNLVFLSVPGDLIFDDFFETLRVVHGQRKPLPLEVLEFAFSHTGDALEFEWQSLIDTLDNALANLRAVGVHDMFIKDLWPCEVEDALAERAEKQDLPVSKDTEEYEVGVYCIYDN